MTSLFAWFFAVGLATTGPVGLLSAAVGSVVPSAEHPTPEDSDHSSTADELLHRPDASRRRDTASAADSRPLRARHFQRPSAPAVMMVSRDVILLFQRLLC
jgi:hypothetical protein